MSIYRKASDVEAKLGVAYDGPTKEIEGNTYIPWPETRKQFDNIFGPLGWSNQVVQVEAHPREGIYVAAGSITVHMVDDETGEVITVTKGNVGRSTAMASKAEREETNSPVSRNLKIHDTAAAASASDLFSRIAKMFGPAFGSELYDKGGNGSSYGGGSRSGGNLGPRPSEKQQGVLSKNGYTPEQVAGLDFKTWKAVVDALFKGETPAVKPEGEPQRKRQAPKDDDDLGW